MVLDPSRMNPRRTRAHFRQLDYEDDVLDFFPHFLAAGDRREAEIAAVAKEVAAAPPPAAVTAAGEPLPASWRTAVVKMLTQANVQNVDEVVAQTWAETLDRKLTDPQARKNAFRDAIVAIVGG